ncbi:hypothetical protein GCM10011531_07780 [Aquaticitalea lipolytica]|uniref:Uncharacterized protein n=1 Tax=Aquaticitalea lipolytica TaxID=1247562 RepID=A0A8J2XFR1_9FLAO|nr:hypothetical protein [Aquaticitalea lipolytica]GFZ80233.1 hypothetical protein GCM10011531_07780 [Aquaticitalea lipolytica]
MNQTQSQFYQESGIANPLNISLSVTCSLIAICILSFLYSIITHYLPLVYFNFLIAIGFGISISFVSRFFNSIFKIRNRKKSIIITLVLAFIAVCFQWIWYLYIINSVEFSFIDGITFFINMIFRPDLVIENIIIINKFGVWEMFGTTFKGIVLWLVWLVEAAIIMFLSYNNYLHFQTIPFSEKDNKWFKKDYIDFDFEHIAFKKEFIEKFQINPSEAISELKKGDGLRHSKISVYKSDTEQKSIVTIDNIRVTERGKGKKDITTVLEPIYVDNQHLIKIRNSFKFKKASIFEF